MFSAVHNIYGREPWFSSGDKTNTFMLSNINPQGDSSPMEFTAVNNLIYFTANDGLHGRNLYVTDLQKTHMLNLVTLTTRTGYNPHNLTALNNRVLYLGRQK